MFDSGLHQATSLQNTATQADLRIIPVVSHGAGTTDQAVMWELCAALQVMGYPVVVLDGTCAETADNPGLADLLHDALWEDASAPDAEGMAVIPAACGLSILPSYAQSGPTPLHSLQGLFRMYRAVVIYADATTLAPLLYNSDAEPLIFLPPDKKTVVSAYNSFKQLHMQAGSLATLVTVVPHADDAAMAQQATRVQLAVRNCAQTYMGSMPRSFTVRLDQQHDVQRLALQLLENAINIGSMFSTMPLLATVADGCGVRNH